MGGDRRSHRTRVDGLYCPTCGDSLEPSMNYCPGCGASVGRSSIGSTTAFSRQRRSSADPVPTREAPGERPSLEYRIAAATTDGWTLEHDFGDHVVMVRRTVGSVSDHLAIALLTGWWTMGVGNVLYGVYRYANDAERIVLSADRTAERPGDESTRSPLFGWAIAAVCWLTAAILVATAVQVAATTAALVLGVLALIVGLGGTSVLPSVRRRLENRRSVTANGRVRSVDERAVVDPAEPCTACAAPIEGGIERTYRTEYCLLGVPVTSRARHNHYCRTCANAETHLDSADPTAEPTAPPDRTTHAESTDDARAADHDSPASDTSREPEHDRH